MQEQTEGQALTYPTRPKLWHWQELPAGTTYAATAEDVTRYADECEDLLSDIHALAAAYQKLRDKQPALRAVADAAQRMLNARADSKLEYEQELRAALAALKGGA